MKLTKFVALTLLGLLLATAVKAQGILLTVDISNPSAVIFTATTNYAAMNSYRSIRDGFDLLKLFTSVASVGGSDTNGTLIGGNSGNPYSTYYGDNASGSIIDLGFVGTGFTYQTFTTTSTAFTGAWTIDLSGATPQLPLPGAIGNIQTGFGASPGQVIGQWQVIGTAPVPEPGTLALAALGGIGAWFGARRKK